MYSYWDESDMFLLSVYGIYFGRGSNILPSVFFIYIFLCTITIFDTHFRLTGYIAMGRVVNI